MKNRKYHKKKQIHNPIEISQKQAKLQEKFCGASLKTEDLRSNKATG
jgi:hypothetical protein